MKHKAKTHACLAPRLLKESGCKGNTIRVFSYVILLFLSFVVSSSSGLHCHRKHDHSTDDVLLSGKRNDDWSAISR